VSAKVKATVSYARCELYTTEAGLSCYLCGKEVKPNVLHVCGTSPPKLDQRVQQEKKKRTRSR